MKSTTLATILKMGDAAQLLVRKVAVANGVVAVVREPAQVVAEQSSAGSMNDLLKLHDVLVSFYASGNHPGNRESIVLLPLGTLTTDPVALRGNKKFAT
jgi:hypothetical protein